jgi:hypothetical protein
MFVNIDWKLSYLSTTDKQWLAMSGGHGYSPTLGAVQNGTLINMRNFQYSYVNNDFTMTVGSGSKFRDMVNTAAASGREVNVGNCPCVGGLGATLGGGLGRLQGLRGLTSDALTAVRMVLWNGTIIEASEESHADLFWGLRGAGQNFGIIAEADYRTWPLTNGGMHYSADMIFDRSNLSTLIETSNALLPLDARLALQHSYFYDVANSRVSWPDFLLLVSESFLIITPAHDWPQRYLCWAHGGGSGVLIAISSS